MNSVHACEITSSQKIQKHTAMNSMHACEISSKQEKNEIPCNNFIASFWNNFYTKDTRRYLATSSVQALEILFTQNIEEDTLQWVQCMLVN